MKGAARLIVKKRVLILVIAVLLVFPSILGFARTKVNYDILTYLPEQLDSMVGQKILDQDFHSASMAMITVENLKKKQVDQIAEHIRTVDGVRDVLWIGDILAQTPSEMIPEDIRLMLDNGSCQLMLATFEEGNGSDRTLKAMGQIEDMLEKQAYIGGLAAIVHDTKSLIMGEMPLYVAVAVLLSMAVLLLGLKYNIAPLIFLLGIFFAIVYNFGTNVFLGQISYITQALAAILQLAVSMDFSIFLLGRYDEELGKGADSEEAMTEAVANTFSAISGSSLTTIAGFLAMCTMDLKLGTDMGLVMAKGVVLGVLSAVVILPALILQFDKSIHSHQHRTMIPKLKGVARFTTTHYKAILIVSVLLIIPFGAAQSKVSVYYNLIDSLPQDLTSTVGTQKLRDEFNMTTTHFILADDQLEPQKMQQLLTEIKDTEGIAAMASLDEFLGAGLPADFLPQNVRKLFDAGGRRMILANSVYTSATAEQNHQLEELETKIKALDPSAIITGEGALNKDLVQIADHDFQIVNIVSILAVFLIIAAVFKSVSIPLFLVAAIEMAITINMGIPYFAGQTIPFIASIVIGTIQLGATIDYAILMTTRYREERNHGYERREAVRIAVENCSESIITSGLSFFAANIGVAAVSRIDLIKSLCSMLARGALISMAVILLVLPALLMVFGGLMEKTSFRFIKK